MQDFYKAMATMDKPVSERREGETDSAEVERGDGQKPQELTCTGLAGKFGRDCAGNSPHLVKRKWTGLSSCVKKLGPTGPGRR